jgi:ubiquinone/menaquinone biosynthesis C-methylase UbiE
MKMLKYFQTLGSRYKYVGLEKSVGLKYLSEKETEFIGQNISKNKKTLDIGIGTGRITNQLLSAGNTVTGLDGAESMIEYCNHFFKVSIKSKKLDLIKHDLESPMPFRNRIFEQITCIRVIKYIDNWEQFLEELSRIIKKNGRLIIEFPNIRSYESISIIINIFLGIRYQAFTFAEFSLMLSSLGFEIIGVYHGVRLPHFIYRITDSELILKYIIGIETGLQRIFGDHFNRNYILVCRHN